MLFKRKVYQDLLQWKHASQGETAILLEGARRIGKSTIAEEFAKREYSSYMILDFAIEPEEVKELFRTRLHDLNAFFRDLFVLKGRELPAHNSVVIMDEIQLFPLARQAIKYLVKDGRYDYIETGSLITIRKNAEQILIPSEEYRIKMFPMDFEEFLWAAGDTATYPVIREAFDSGKALGETLHQKIFQRFREYMAVGGMPQAVDAFVKGRTYGQIDFMKRSILSLYEADLATWDHENRERASVIFRTIPEQLSNHNSHFRFSLVDKNARYRNYIEAVGFVAESMMGNECIGVTQPEIDLETYADRSNFKLYMGDTGLLVSQMLRYDESEKDDIYKAILFQHSGINTGMIMENIVAQMLRAGGHELYFHEFSYAPPDSAEKKYEIDFLTVRKHKICPIEVKSSDYKRHASFDCFQTKYRNFKMQDRFIIYTKDVQTEGNIRYVPAYMTGLI